MHIGTEVRRITEMGIFASLLRGAYKLSGAKKAFGLPDRGVFVPIDHKAD